MREWSYFAVGVIVGTFVVDGKQDAVINAMVLGIVILTAFRFVRWFYSTAGKGNP